VDPIPQGKERRAPETQGVKPFNPFAADVYQTARLFYGWFPDIVHNVPSLLKLLQDMSCYNPSRRITASTALARLRTFRSTIPDDNLARELCSFPHIPQSNLIMLRDILECGHWAFAFQFTWKLLETWLRSFRGKKKMKKMEL
jgi:hypothetical protein